MIWGGRKKKKADVVTLHAAKCCECGAIVRPVPRAELPDVGIFHSCHTFKTQKTAHHCQECDLYLL